MPQPVSVKVSSRFFPFMAMSSEMLPLLGVNLNAFDRMLVHILRILS